MKRRDVLLLVVVGAVLFAGCVEVTSTAEVGADGEIDEMTIETELPEPAYDELENEAQTGGYGSVEEMIEAKVVEEMGEDTVGTVTASTDSPDGLFDDGRVTVIAEDVDPDGLDGVTVSVDDDTVRYEGTDVLDHYVGDSNDDVADAVDEYEEDILIEYSVTMPGEIRETNADDVSGTTATWTFTADEPQDVYAESTTEDDGAGADDEVGADDGGAGDTDDGPNGTDDASGTDADDGSANDGSDGDGADDEPADADGEPADADGASSDDGSNDEPTDAADTVPGFGIGAAALALLVGLGLAVRRR